MSEAMKMKIDNVWETHAWYLFGEQMVMIAEMWSKFYLDHSAEGAQNLRTDLIKWQQKRTEDIMPVYHWLELVERAASNQRQYDFLLVKMTDALACAIISTPYEG